MAGHGKRAGLVITDTGGSAFNLGKYCDTIDYPNAVDTADVTAFNTTQGRKVYVSGLGDGTISVSGPYSTTPDGILYGLARWAAASASSNPTYSLYPNTTAAVATLTSKYAGSMLITAYNPSAGVGDATRFTAEFQQTGAVTRTTAP